MGKPPDPPPIGRGPTGPNPRFETVGPKEPKGQYASVIGANAPLDAGQVNRVAKVANPFSSNRKTSGDQSRAAFSRALADTTTGSLKRAQDQFSQQFRQQAEKSRAEDVLAQRQNVSDRFRMDMYRAIFDKDTSTRYVEGAKDLSQYYETEKKNEQAKRTAILLSFLGGLL